MTLRKFWSAWASNNVIGIALIALAILSGVTTYVQAERTARLAECTAGYQAGFSQALKARTQSQQEFNNSLNELLRSVAEAKAPTEVRDALSKYIKAASERDAQLQAHPYPDPVVCQG